MTLRYTVTHLWRPFEDGRGALMSPVPIPTGLHTYITGPTDPLHTTPPPSHTAITTAQRASKAKAAAATAVMPFRVNFPSMFMALIRGAVSLEI